MLCVPAPGQKKDSDQGSIKPLLLLSAGPENRAGDFYFPVVMTSLESLVTDQDLFIFVNIYIMWFERVEKRGVKKHGGGESRLFIAPI